MCQELIRESCLVGCAGSGPTTLRTIRGSEPLVGRPIQFVLVLDKGEDADRRGVFVMGRHALVMAAAGGRNVGRASRNESSRPEGRLRRL